MCVVEHFGRAASTSDKEGANAAKATVPTNAKITAARTTVVVFIITKHLWLLFIHFRM